MRTRACVAMLAAGMTTAASMALAADDDKKMLPGDFTGSLALTTDYLFRGISQTDNSPSVQGVLEWEYAVSPEFKPFLGIFASNLDFNDGNEATIEMDFYGGFRGEIAGFTYSIGGIGYVYPGANSDLNYDYAEAAFKLGYDFGFAAVTGAINYSPDYFAASGDAVYVAGDVAVPLPFIPLETKLLFHVGRQWIDKNDRFGTPDYTDWNIGIATTIDGFTLTLAYADTSLSKNECFGGRNLCDGRVLFTVSKAF